MKESKKRQRVFRALRSYLMFFALISFLVTCTTMLFVTTMSSTLGFELTDENIGKSAKFTFGNVIVLSLMITVIDAFRRRITLERTSREIASAAKRLAEGDFTVRVSNVGRNYTDDSFNQIVDCFNKMAAELSSVETLSTDFIANVSHELKTPLSVISNYSSLLASSDITEDDRREYARAITNASRQLSEMITNILRLSRLENKEIFPRCDSYDLSEQICECLLGFENIWESKNITVDTDIDDGITVSQDREMLSLVWNNLFSNAFKFTDIGGTVSVSLHSVDGRAVVSVSDTGCGMSREVGEHIFEKFYQGDTSHATAGNGLGLALVRRVVDVIGGDIFVESTLGVGSVFTVVFGR